VPVSNCSALAYYPSQRLVTHNLHQSCVRTHLSTVRHWELQNREGEGGVGKCSRHRRVTTLTFALLRYSVAIFKKKATKFRNIFFLGRKTGGVLLRNRSRPCENSIGPQFLRTVLYYVFILRGLIREIVVKFSREEVLQFLGNGLVRWLMFRHPRFPVC
jgi:hypothetical protein